MTGQVPFETCQRGVVVKIIQSIAHYPIENFFERSPVPPPPLQLHFPKGMPELKVSWVNALSITLVLKFPCSQYEKRITKIHFGQNHVLECDG